MIEWKNETSKEIREIDGGQINNDEGLFRIQDSGFDLIGSII
jgi:hypothetical protein